jgi:ABC-type transporter Mla MlaB component
MSSSQASPETPSKVSDSTLQSSSDGQAVAVVPENDRLYLQGSVSIDNVSRYRDQIINAFEEKPELAELDLSRAEINGSSVMALLISIQRYALSSGRELQIVNPQAKLLEMAEMNGLIGILPFASK